MKTIKIIVMVLSLSVMYQFAVAQSACNGNKVRMVKGAYRCGCHCQKKCVALADVPSYQANGWGIGDDCFGNCCWIRQGEKAPAVETSLEEIYPNPASGSVNIAFTLSQGVEVTFELFDVAGRYLTTFEHNLFEEGGNEVTLNASELNDGIYFLKMNAGSYTAMKRISIIK